MKVTITRSEQRICLQINTKEDVSDDDDALDDTIETGIVKREMNSGPWQWKSKFPMHTC